VQYRTRPAFSCSLFVARCLKSQSAAHLHNARAGCCCDFSKARRGWASSYRGRRPAGAGGIVEAHEIEHVGGFAAKLEGKPFSKVDIAEETYADITARLVPSWMPFRLALAYLTSVGQIGCGLAIIFSVFPQAAAMVETVMLALFAFLVWGPDTWFASTPKMAGSPSGPRFPLTAFLITWVIGAAALLIAASYSSPSKRSGIAAGKSAASNLA